MLGVQIRSSQATGLATLLCVKPGRTDWPPYGFSKNQKKKLKRDRFAFIVFHVQLAVCDHVQTANFQTFF